MHAPSRLAFVAWFVVSAGGCAAVTGLDNISEQDCAPNCNDAQTKNDVTTDSPGTDSPSGQDQTAGDDTGSQPEGSSGGETSTGEGSTGEGGTKEGGSEAASEAAVDAPPYDAPFDSGCGDLNTTGHCSACPDTCAPSSASVTSASCNGPTNGAGATCSYTCATGYLDCNATLDPPDLDGCECHSPNATTASCGSGVGGTPGCCPVQHTDGLPSGTTTFFDCVPQPVGTTGYTEDLATDACVQFTGNQADCGAGECTGANDAGTGDFVVCGQTSATSECACWEYMGPNNGKVTTTTGAQIGECFCPGSTGAGINQYSYN